ncbi:hypothetical protein [[Mycoplasma] mobile]|uniref:hypothetical protein n=1 Tax=[Mycoplasma] mobile TaxID=2118 RepID=UPI0002F80EE9|nr:hypothetical protein [[Mycoplasma] mobile]
MKNPFGIYPKIRIDYLQRDDFKIGENKYPRNTTLFDFSKKNNWENLVIKYLWELKNEK